MATIVLTHQVQAGDVIALEDSEDFLDMDLPLDEQTASWEPAQVLKARLFPATSTMDLHFEGGYIYTLSMGEEIFKLS